MCLDAILKARRLDQPTPLTTKPSETASAADAVRQGRSGDGPDMGSGVESVDPAKPDESAAPAPDLKAALAKVRDYTPHAKERPRPADRRQAHQTTDGLHTETAEESAGAPALADAAGAGGPVEPAETTGAGMLAEAEVQPADTADSRAADTGTGTAAQPEDDWTGEFAVLLDAHADSNATNAGGETAAPADVALTEDITLLLESDGASPAVAADDKAASGEPKAAPATSKAAALDTPVAHAHAGRLVADATAPDAMAPAPPRSVDSLSDDRAAPAEIVPDAPRPDGADGATDANVAVLPAPAAPRRRNWPLAVRLAAFVAGVPVLLLALIYAVLLIGPVNLSFAKPNVEQMIRAALPPEIRLELGDLTLSLSASFRPVLRFAPVAVTDTGTGAEVDIEALEIGVSPLETLIGQPAAVVSLVAPELQLVQDLLGPRLATFASREDLPSGETLVEIRQGDEVYPEVLIGPDGLKVSGPPPRGDGVGIRSDNEWLVYNLEGLEHLLADFEGQAVGGRLARFEVRGGIFEMLDPVYGIMRRFDDLDLVVTPFSGGRPTKGTIRAVLAGREIAGAFEHRAIDTGGAELGFSIQNLDFASLIPALDDPAGMMAIRGAGALGGTIVYDRAGGAATSGQFTVDLGGTQFRLREDMFPVTRADLVLDWQPGDSRFLISQGAMEVGDSSVRFDGEVVFGLNDYYGPVFSAGLMLRDLTLSPYDLGKPAEPFDEVSIRAWAAPLYGAIGLDRMVATKPGVEIRASGRFDMIRSGIGIDLEVGGEGASVDDLKRLWPYFIAPGGRDWFVEHVKTGRMTTGSLRFDLPVGTIDPNADDAPLPPDSGWINLRATDVTIIPTEGFSPVALGGEVELTLRDNETFVELGTTRIVSEDGQFAVSDLSVDIDASARHESVIEFSGDVSGDIPALIGFAESQSPGVIDGLDLPFDARALSGRVSGAAVMTMRFGADPAPLSIDYAVNGLAEDFASDVKIADRIITDGQLTFRATPDAYHVEGTAELDGMAAELMLDGGANRAADIRIASTIDAAEFEKFGFDVSDLLSGSIRFVAKPIEDGAMQLAVDLTEARVDIKDLGIAKPSRVPGTLNAEIRLDGTKTEITKIDVAFANVRLKGEMVFDAETGLVSADFSDFALSAGDSARLSIAPGEAGGYQVQIVGDQFDLKPMLRRYFALDKTSTGSPQATSVPQEISVKARLNRALGFFSTTAYNVELGLDLRGENLLDASLQGQFAEGNSVSLTTNPTTGGRLMTVAFNDAGTLLRFLNVYPRLLGGSGSLTLRTDVREKVDYGEIRIRDFSIVDEDKVAEIVGNHQDSRQLIAAGNRLNFQNGQASFIRRSDRIELVDAVVDGGSIGATLKGFIYTKARQYDLTGTYIPLFGLNNMFQQLPLIGELLGGRDGEGAFGVTFAVRGALDAPNVIVNPVSLLAPGVFRSIFEFRATEAPREDTTGQ